MHHRILLVIPNRELRDFILDCLEDHFKTSDILKRSRLAVFC